METIVNGSVKKIKAAEGKRLIFILDGSDYGKEVTLGYINYMNNEKLDTPILLKEGMFREVDDNGGKKHERKKHTIKTMAEIRQEREEKRKEELSKMRGDNNGNI